MIQSEGDTKASWKKPLLTLPKHSLPSIRLTASCWEETSSRSMIIAYMPYMVIHVTCCTPCALQIYSLKWRKLLAVKRWTLAIKVIHDMILDKQKARPVTIHPRSLIWSAILNRSFLKCSILDACSPCRLGMLDVSMRRVFITGF